MQIQAVVVVMPPRNTGLRYLLTPILVIDPKSEQGIAPPARTIAATDEQMGRHKLHFAAIALFALVEFGTHKSACCAWYRKWTPAVTRSAAGA